MKFATTGDFLIHIPAPAHHAGLDAIAAYMGDADCRVTNLETTITEGECYANAYYPDASLTASPEVLDTVKRLGIQACGVANNHTMDYAIDGVLATMKHLDAAGIKRAGIGRDLHEASRAATINTDSGAVAYIAQVCLNRKNESGRAGYSHDGIPARPGVNGLRRIDESLVTPEQMAYIKDLAKQTMVNAQEDLEKAYGYGDLDDGTFSYGVMKFRVAEKTGRISRVNEEDMQRTEREIRNAKCNHAFALVAIHSHQFKALAEDEPDYYLEEYAHRCIDAGADAVIGSGNHLLKGIEIYKDRPIFYGLANFIFQPDYVDKTPADIVEMYGFPLTMSGAEISAARVAKSAASMERNQIFYLSVVPKWTIENGKLTEIKLLPIELGMKEPWGLRGFPSPVSPDWVFENLQRVCKPFGTELKINGDTIDVIL